MFSVIYNKHLLSSYVCGFIGMSLIQGEGPFGSGVLHVFLSEVQDKRTVTI